MKQIMILTEEAFIELPVDFKEEMTFEDYINLELGMLYDEKRTIENISHSDDMKRFMIVYRIPVTSKSKN